MSFVEEQQDKATKTFVESDNLYYNTTVEQIVADTIIATCKELLKDSYCMEINEDWWDFVHKEDIDNLIKQAKE